IRAAPAGPAAARQRARPAGVPPRDRPPGGRPPHLRRARGGRLHGRGRAAVLLPRPLRSPARPHDMTRVPLSRPPVDDEIKQAVLAAIEARQYGLGTQCRQLETELAAAPRVKHPGPTSSATPAPRAAPPAPGRATRRGVSV